MIWVLRKSKTKKKGSYVTPDITHHSSVASVQKNEISIFVILFYSFMCIRNHLILNITILSHSYVVKIIKEMF